ncbi:1-aminocyclopropane-1-carboxylate deaminase/D-cysteine desulfhydrase [Alteromonas facilis]|uniref:1-aminocyclopropane-1-carboxylate deaminase/D-cysteine desulfhydrase n=1 Tax=Alteromonas facilis TaxID=2048004 RepID=UPI000C289D1B|nr:pyridoxal-phosphate dependent enzyme [Alteromonas facilis]
MESVFRQLEINTPSPIQRITPDWANAREYALYVKRDDLLHPIISGNKWRKLQPIVQQLQHATSPTLASFGGGHSNHIHALAYVCHRLNWPFHAIIRGNYENNFTPMLNDIVQWGAHIHFITKREYQHRHEPDYLARLKKHLDLDVIIPEGGSHAEHLVGMQTLADELTDPNDYLITPVASGGTLAGLACASSNIKHLIGIAVLKGKDYLEPLVAELIAQREVKTPYAINHDFHFGGYAKAPLDLRQFCQAQSAHLNIPFEPVYSGKALYAMKSFVEGKAFPLGSRITLLHTGGLQGARG